MVEMFTKKIHLLVEKLIRPLIIVLDRLRIHPNLVTVLGSLLAVVGAIFIAQGKIKTGASILILACFFDLIDGALARYSNLETEFGAFLDSLLDRYIEGIIFIGIAYYFLSQNYISMVILTIVTLIGSFGVSYARARAENIISSCEIGVGRRETRLIVLGIFAFLGWYYIGLIIVAFLAYFATGQRVYHVFRELKKQTFKEIK